MNLIPIVTSVSNHDYSSACWAKWTVPPLKHEDGRSFFPFLLTFTERRGIERRKPRVRQIPSIEELRLRPQVTEEEGARLVGRAKKALGNLRRKKEIPRDLYCQRAPNTKVYYYTQRLLAYFESDLYPLKKRRI